MTLAAFLALGLGGCTGKSPPEKLRLAMYDQPRYEPLEGSGFFGDGRSARPRVPNTVARGRIRTDRHLYTGMTDDGEPVPSFPFPVTRDVLERGRDRYDVFCSPCHDRAGTGQGMAVRRGFRTPPSLHILRLRESPPGYFFDVMTNGFGAMYSYASRISPHDRWAVAAYVRALQLSQRARMDDVPADLRQQLEEE